MRKLFGWRTTPSLGRHRLGNPAYPNLYHYVMPEFEPIRAHRDGPPSPRVAKWTPGPKGILA